MVLAMDRVLGKRLIIMVKQEDSKDKLLLKERLGAIKEMVGDKVTYVDL